MTTPSTPSSSSVEALRAREEALARAEHLEALLRFRRAVLVGAVLWPSFGVVDVIALHTFARTTAPLAILGPRFASAGVIALVVAWIWRAPAVTPRQLVVFDQLLYGQANVSIGLMCLNMGGLSSLYLTGACLVVTARMFVLPYTWKRGVLAALFPTLAAPLTVLVGVLWRDDLRPQLHQANALAEFGLNVAYLVTTAIFMVAGGHILSSLRRQVFAERNIGRYRLRHRIGIGGMGEVWTAWHPGLRRDVALKILKPTGDDPAAASRFEREVRATSELTHPNTIRVFDFGSTEDGLLYYAMELLVGEDLSSLMARVGPLPPARAVHLVDQAARALAEAHARGIVHRDVKPDNLFVTSAGIEADFVKVLDFGIARFEQGEAETRLTSTDAVVGTPRYMAPETLRGIRAGPRADVYALGGVLYYALTGRPPFDAADKVALMGSLLGSAEAPEVQAPGVTAELRAVVARALTKNLDGRFASAGELALALRAVPEYGQWHPAAVPLTHAEPVTEPSAETLTRPTPLLAPGPPSSEEETAEVRRSS